MEETANNHPVWQDITKEFMDSAKQLNLGELIKIDHFTLLEAMGAIELMDPKMDGGLMLKKCNKKILNLEQSVRLGLVKVNNLELDELCGIIDETYARLVTWLDGHSLAQTVMTNLYLHEPERIEDRCLRVFSQSTLKLVDFIDSIIQMVLTIEEEDFVLNMGKFNLANQISDHKVFNSLEDVCQQYERLLIDKPVANNRPAKNQSDQQQQQQQPQQGDTRQYDKSQLNAIVDRLRFTYHFYACFLNLSRNNLKDSPALLYQNDAQLQKCLRQIQQSVLISDQHLEKCTKYLTRWKDSIDMGIKAKISEDLEPNEADYPTIMGFEPLINYKLMPLAFPRCPSIKSRPETVEYFEGLVAKLRRCIAISSSFSQRSFEKSIDSIEKFSKYFRPSSCVLSRSLLLALYLPSRSHKLLRDELLQSLTDYCEPAIQEIRKDEAKMVHLEGFLAESSKTFAILTTIFGHNLARQHEKITEHLQTFKNLQYSAFLIANGAFNNPIVFSWATYQFARLCINFVLAGLELELYSPYEFPYVFWYLYDILYRNEREQMETAKQYIIQSQSLSEQENMQKKSKNRKQRNRKNQFSTICHDRLLLINDAFRFLTGGTFLLTYGLRLQGKIRSPVADFTNEEVCFYRRFGSINGTPAFQSYKNTLSRLEKLEYIYREALECFSEAKELFQVVGPSYDDCLKVCKTNMVVAKILSTNSDSFANRDIEFSFDLHASFPTVKF